MTKDAKDLFEILNSKKFGKMVNIRHEIIINNKQKVIHQRIIDNQWLTN